MIEMTCASCLKTFERRGAKRGKQPECMECRDVKEAARKKYDPEKYKKKVSFVDKVVGEMA